LSTNFLNTKFLSKNFWTILFKHFSSPNKFFCWNSKVF
jgi:hypothetical protein